MTLKDIFHKMNLSYGSGLQGPSASGNRTFMWWDARSMSNIRASRIIVSILEGTK